MRNAGPGPFRFIVRIAVVSAALIAGAGFSVHAGQPAAGKVSAGLEGPWEGFIAETTARLSRIGVEMKRSGEGWEGTIDLSGAPPGLPLSAIRLDGAALHFELQAGETLVLFDAELTEDAISGRVVEGERAFTFDLHRLPVYPKPANRVEAWKQDLEVVRTRFLKYDRSFNREMRVAFEATIDELERSLPEMNDQEVIVTLSEAVALSGNAHTRLYLLRNRTELRRLPVRLYWFTDGLYVIRATSGYGDLPGCRVSRIAGRDPRSVRARVARLFAGNASWVEYKSPYFMTSPEILFGLGMIDDMENVSMQFTCGGREPFERQLKPLPLQRTKKPTEAWRDLAPASADQDETEHGGAAGGWIGALRDRDPAPLYLRDPRQRYWFEYLEDGKSLYVQYNRSQNMPNRPSVADFAAQVEAFIGGHAVDRLILDLRFNTGGNNGLAAPFMERLAVLEREKTIGRLYVITGRATFSAGISHAAWLKQYSDATFVGEPVGDELDTWSEGGNIVLPNSGLTVHFTNGFHSLSSIEHPKFEQYEWSDLDLEDLDPDVPVRLSSDDYFSGRDPALAAILSGAD